MVNMFKEKTMAKEGNHSAILEIPAEVKRQQLALMCEQIRALPQVLKVECRAGLIFVTSSVKDNVEGDKLRATLNSINDGVRAHAKLP